MKPRVGTRVVVLGPTGTETHVVPPGADAVVGRAKDCEVVVPLPSMSRRHVRILHATNGDRPRVEDLGGVHGIKVAGRKASPGKPVTVQRGDVVDAGDVLLLVHPDDEPTLVRVDPSVVEMLAASNVSVIVIGETGTGKSFVATTLLGPAPSGSVTLHDNVTELPSEKGRFVATTKRHDIVSPRGVIGLLLPPLRDRPRAIEPLAERFLAAACARAGMPVPPLSREALGSLVRHSWMGNVLELKNTMDRAAVLSGGREIEPRHLVFDTAPLPPQTMQTLPPTTTISSVPPRRDDR